ncbi:unnamed protein product [Orchesella dallaii]|uniref:BZIP domain-containing protein n=1 Tax=Orchesella dallaii TaxID=48710 RepID=A0ABP1RN22_9HEXA
MEPVFILILDDNFHPESPTQPQIILELPNNFVVASYSVEVIENVQLLQGPLRPLLQSPGHSSHYIVDKSDIENFRVEQETCTSNISVATSNMGTEETAIKVEPPSEETLDETQSNFVEEASSLEEPTATFSTEQLLKLTTKKQRKSPIKSVPEGLKNEKYYENRKKNAQASRLWRERKKKLDQERVNLINSSLQEVEQLKMELEGYKPMVEKYSQLQRNYAALQQIVAKFLASRQH